MEDAPIRIGIIGCAMIAYKVCRAIQLAPNATVAAVASRSVEKAAAFAMANGLPPEAKIYGSYEALLDDPDIDAVYLPLPTGLHHKWAILTAQKKKHLLMEKPVALNVGEFDEIVKACEENGVQFMDGTMWMHHPRTQKMEEFLKDKAEFGQLKSIHSCFTFYGDENFLESNIRVKPELDGLGALGDAGWYGIRASLWANDYDLPKTVTAMPDALLNEAGVILACGASLVWEDGKVATFYCSFLSNLTDPLTVIGTYGTLHLNDYVLPWHDHEASYTTTPRPVWDGRNYMPLPVDHTVASTLPQEACMVREFATLVQNIKKNGAQPDPKWPTISRKTQLVVDAIKVSIDKGFQPVEIVG
ncbi:hypothetical protein CCACVL1_25329 [Corchorus capsularis]|uniref:Uncharacterized protein n=1 Tax=Corchorus capsularis TaxID=210143 RepID=A0A1R3GL90_COCAP|nr:hypothetical protein CCACVL1_25329 [Corchorus capsularis]